MPSSTPKQANLMRAVAHGFKPDQFKGPSVKVAKEFEAADEKKNKGGAMSAADKKTMAKALRKKGKTPEKADSSDHEYGMYHGEDREDSQLAT